MNRTGIIPDHNAIELYLAMVSDPNIIAKGFHVYDGHIHNEDVIDREQVCNKDFEPVLQLKENLQEIGVVVSNIIAGGSITFPIHAKRDDVDLSPGTTLLWDADYGIKYKDLDFVPARR